MIECALFIHENFDVIQNFIKLLDEKLVTVRR
jgi:hypothetical protein